MLKIYNTLTRKKEEFIPLYDNEARVYTCGPTVYNYAHIGNLRAYIFADVLIRTLRYNGYKVKWVMNITDVGHLTSDADIGEDKLEKGARREKKTVWEIAQYYTKKFHEDTARLNISKPTVECRATDHIKEQINLIKKLEKKGVTYRTSDGIYFDTSLIKDYGKLAGGQLKEIQAGKRVELGEKKNPTDFALWKFSPQDKKRQMEWESPWGVGFPGWHIECSAMSMKYLGETFDIHTGGIDHIPIHHTNEIAQSETATGKLFVRYWMHSAFLVLDKGEKMAKSGENFVTLDVLVKKGFWPLAYRYLTFLTHYRKPLHFSFSALQAAQTALQDIYEKVAEWPKGGKAIPEYKTKFLDYLNDDLNMPRVIALVHEIIASSFSSPDKRATLEEMDKVLALDLGKQKKAAIPAQVKKWAQERQAARQAKDWERADALREKIEKEGYIIEDISLTQYKIKKKL